MFFASCSAVATTEAELLALAAEPFFEDVLAFMVVARTVTAGFETTVMAGFDTAITVGLDTTVTAGLDTTVIAGFVTTGASCVVVVHGVALGCDRAVVVVVTMILGAALIGVGATIPD